MKKGLKKVLLVVGGFVLLAGIFVIIMFVQTKRATDKMVNVDIDMEQVADGVYKGSSDGGLVQVEVEVEVKDHKIMNIDLLKHQNGKGEAAESTIDDMVRENTDDVDGVSGATTSSKTIRNAVNKALQKGLTK